MWTGCMVSMVLAFERVARSSDARSAQRDRRNMVRRRLNGPALLRPAFVMAVPVLRTRRAAKAWVPGTRPGRTAEEGDDGGDEPRSRGAAMGMDLNRTAVGRARP